MTKTFDEYLTDNPNLYSGISGFAWSTDANKWIETDVSQVTKDLISDWFGLRHVCDDENFERFFSRKMNITALRFAQLSRIELSAFDPLVANYVERQILNSNNRTTAGNVSETGSVDSTGSNNVSTVRTPDLEESINGSSSGTSHRGVNESDVIDHNGTRQMNQGGTDVTTNNLTTNDNDVQVQKSAPMSIEYAGASAGNIPNLAWNSLTAQQQGKHDHSENGSQSVAHGLTENVSDGYDETKNHNVTDSNTESSNNQQTRKTMGEEETVSNGTSSNHSASSKTNISSGTESGNGESHEIMTGRNGLTPQEAFGKAVTYLKGSSAFEWLRKELEPCFMGVYDI